MRRPRRRYHHGSLATDAIAATALEVDAQGHEGFTLDRVARRLGVTSAALYRHFDGRQELLKAFVWETYLRFAREMDAAFEATPSARERVLALARVLAAFALKNPGWFRLQFSRAGMVLAVKHDAAEPKYPALMRAAIGTLLGTDDEGAVEKVYLTAWGLAHGVASLLLENVWSHVQTDAERLALVEVLCSGYVDGLRRNARPPVASKKKGRAPPARRRLTARSPGR